MRGISTIIATIVLLLITISLAGTAYMFFSGVFTGKTATTIEVLSGDENTIIIRNSGTDVISAGEIKILANDREMVIDNPQDIAPGAIAILKIRYRSCLDILGFSIGSDVVIMGPSNSVRYLPSKSVSDGVYSINPDGSGSFDVYCDMSTDGGGWTLFSHDSETRTHVNGLEPPGSYSRTINYEQTLDQIISVLDISSTAKQYLLYECKGSVLRTDWGGGAYGWWTDRVNNKMTYWPNGNSNCDINDGVWRQDGGWLTAINELPIRSVRFGDTGSSGEEGYHTIGKVWVR